MNSHDPTTPSGAGWFKSTRSDPYGACVEVKFDQDQVYVRDSKYRRGAVTESAHEPIITVTARQWPLLLEEVAGCVSAGSNGAVTITTDDGQVTMRATRDDTTLTFTTTEWQAFTDGVHAHEFNHPTTTT